MGGPVVFDVRPLPPFRLDLTVWTLRRRPENVIDRWDGSTYRRVLVSDDGSPFEVAVSQSAPPEQPRLTVELEGAVDGASTEAYTRAALDRLLGLQIDMHRFHRVASQDGDLRALAFQFRGFKPPRFATCFEALVNAMACQQISLNVGIQVLSRLVERYGRALQTEAGTFHAFPRPRELAEADHDELRKMGFSHQKARYITGLAQAVESRQLDLHELEALDDGHALDRLLKINGVGRWTAEYCLLRGLGRTHIFPADDVGARRNLQSWLHLRSPMKYEDLRRALAPWHGYEGLVYFHLLLRSLEEKRVLAG